MTKNRYFEDFSIGEIIDHATPRTITQGDVSMGLALYGNRHALMSSTPFAKQLGYRDRPLDDVLVFNMIFGKSVPDISTHAIANLGYGEGLFCAPVYCGDTLSARSEVLGLRENKNGKSGIVMVRTHGFKQSFKGGFNQDKVCVLHYVRWVMVHKRDPIKNKNLPDTRSSIDLPSLDLPSIDLPPVAPFVEPKDLIPPPVDFSKTDDMSAGSAKRFGDYKIGEQIFHCGGTTLSQAEHMMATRLYQNTAHVHFNAQGQAATPHKKRLIYGGHIIAHIRAMSFDGLENAHCLAAINGGTHLAPAFAEDTIYGASTILDKAEVQDRSDIGAPYLRTDVGAVRVRHIATINQPPTPSSFSDKTHLILDFDCWLWMPK
ncbi:MAG: MaoC family dehydratase [Alphaproteobacteria bacterium]|nr:MaoC family dehydratase [Alphaproteobacteria bacterium]